MLNKPPSSVQSKSQLPPCSATGSATSKSVDVGDTSTGTLLAFLKTPHSFTKDASSALEKAVESYKNHSKNTSNNNTQTKQDSSSTNKPALLSPIRTLNLSQFSDFLGLQQVVSTRSNDSLPEHRMIKKFDKKRRHYYYTDVSLSSPSLSPYQRVYKTTAKRPKSRAGDCNSPGEPGIKPLNITLKKSNLCPRKSTVEALSAPSTHTPESQPLVGSQKVQTLQNNEKDNSTLQVSTEDETRSSKVPPTSTVATKTAKSSRSRLKKSKPDNSSKSQLELPKISDLCSTAPSEDHRYSKVSPKHSEGPPPQDSVASVTSSVDCDRVLSVSGETESEKAAAIEKAALGDVGLSQPMLSITPLENILGKGMYH